MKFFLRYFLLTLGCSGLPSESSADVLTACERATLAAHEGHWTQSFRESSQSLGLFEAVGYYSRPALIELFEHPDGYFVQTERSLEPESKASEIALLANAFWLTLKEGYDFAHIEDWVRRFNVVVEELEETDRGEIEIEIRMPEPNPAELYRAVNELRLDRRMIRTFQVRGFSLPAGESLSPVVRETRLFLIAPDPDSIFAEIGSVVIPLSDPAEIDYARRSVMAYQAGGFEGIRSTSPRFAVAASLVPWADGINRDFDAVDAPVWDWSVRSAGFTEIAVQTPNVPREMERALREDSDVRADGSLPVFFVHHEIIGELPFSYDPSTSLETRCSWIGEFKDALYPWIEHTQLGWLYVTGFDPENVWVWSLEGDRWLWLSENSFPWFYDPRVGSWCWFYSGGNGWIYTASSDSWSQNL